MKKRVLLIVTLTIFLFSISLVSAQDRSIDGSTLTTTVTTYTPGVTQNLPLSLVNASTDAEAITSVYLQCSGPVYANAGTTDLTDGGTPPFEHKLFISSYTADYTVTLTWSRVLPNPPVLAGETATGNAFITVDVGTTGQVTLPYTLVGDGAGNPNHTIIGSIVLDPPAPPADIDDIRVVVRTGTEGTGGAAKIDSWIDIEADVTGEGGSPAVTCDVSDFGGPTNLTMTVTRDGTYAASYQIVVSPPVIDDADNVVSVTADNGYSTFTTQADNESFVVDNEVPDFSGSPPDLSLDVDQNSNTIADLNDGTNVDELLFDTSTAVVTGGDALAWAINWKEATGGDVTGIPDGNTMSGVCANSAFSVDVANYDPTAEVVDDAGNTYSGTCNIATAFGLDTIPPDVTGWGSFAVVDQLPANETNGIADYNNDAADDATYTVGTETTGDGITWHVDGIGEFTGDFDSPGTLSRTVVQGTLNNVEWTPDVIVTDNAGNYVWNAPDGTIFVDNVIPDTPTDTYFELNPTRALYASVGDVISAVIDITGMGVVSGTVDFWRLDPVGGGYGNDANYIIPGVIVGNELRANYTVQLGDLQYLPPGPGLGVDAELFDGAGNHAIITFFGDPGDEMYVDAQPPVLVSDITDTGYLRFSPVSTVVAPYTDMPDNLVLELDLPDWGGAGGAVQFTVQIEQEYTRNIIGTITYTVGDPRVNDPGAPGGLITFSWDGTDPNDNVTPMPEGIYGFTLISVQDAAANEAIVSQVVDPADPLYNPAGGVTLLNAVHSVIDETAPVFLEDLVVNGTPATIIVGEDFESGFPVGWTQEHGGTEFGLYGWQVGQSPGFSAPPPHDGDYAYDDSDNYGSGNSQDDYLITPVFNLDPSFSSAYISFDFFYHDFIGDVVTLELRINGGPWNILAPLFDTTPNWINIGGDISALIGAGDIEFAIHYVASYDYVVAIDNFEIGGVQITPITEIHRYIQDNDYSGTVTAGDTFLSVDDAYFQFGVTRAFTENTEWLRQEHIGYWIMIDNTTHGGTVERFLFGDEDSGGTPATGPQGQDYALYTEYVDEDQISFLGTDVNGYAGLPTSISWIPDDTGGPLADGIFPAGFYDIYPVIRDNAGNVQQGATRETVEIIDHLYQPPNINSLLITSVHSDFHSGTPALPDYGPGLDHNFYVDSYYGGNPLNDMYYDTQDMIEITISFDDITYIDYVEILDNVGYGFGTRTFTPTDPEFVGNDLIVTYDVSAIGMGFAALDPGVPYNIGHNVPMPNLEVVVYDVYLGSTLSSAPQEDWYNLIIPEEPVWPTSSITTVGLSDDRFSPGWYSHTYDSEDNPARDGAEDLVGIDIEFDFTPDTATKDFDWYLAIDTDEVDSHTRFTFADARFSRTGSFTALGTVYTVPTINFYGLQNDITLPPLVEEHSTEGLKVTVYAIAQGYEDDGYTDPPGLDESKVVNDLVVDNTNPEFLTETGDPLFDWAGDPYYSGHLYDYEYAVSYAENTMEINFQTSEPITDDNQANWDAKICDYNGDIIPGGYGVNIIGLTHGVDFLNWTMEVEITGLTNSSEFLNSVLVIVGPNDEAANPSHVNDPMYPNSQDPLNPAGDAWRADSFEAYVRFMILKEVPHLNSLQFAHEDTWGLADDSGTIMNAYVNNDGTFDFKVQINNLVYLPTGVQRDITSLVDVDFSDFGLAPGDEAAYSEIVNIKDDNWRVSWIGVPFTDLESTYSTGDILEIPVDFSLIFTGPDAGHTYEESMVIEIIADFQEPTVTIGDPENPVEYRTDVNEGTMYDVKVTVTDDHSGVNKYTTTFTCDDPAIEITGGPGAEPLIYFQDFDFGLPSDWTIVDGYSDGNTWFNTDGLYQWWGPFTFDGTNYMIVDSDFAGSVSMDEQLISPEFNTVGEDNLTLEFDTYFEVYSGFEVAEVDVWDGASWVTVYTFPGWYFGPVSLDVSAYANINFKFRFHYYNAYYDFFWAIDNVVLHNNGIVRDTQIITYQVKIPEDHDNRILNFTAQSMDNVLNLGEGTATWDVTNVPLLDVADFDNINPLALDYLKNEDSAYLYIGIRDSERVDAVHVNLNTDFTYPPVREYYGPEQVLDLTIAEFLALPTDPPGEERNRAVTPTWEYRYLLLENINTTNTIDNCGDILAHVVIDHPYSANPGSTPMDSQVGWLVVDNMIPVITDFTYTITELIPGEQAAVTFTAVVTDYPEICDNSGVNPATVDIDLFGVNGFEHNYVTTFHTPPHDWDGTTATWNFIWDTDFLNALSDPSDIDGFVHLNAEDNLGNVAVTVDEQIDEQPVITDVQFYWDGNPTNVLLPNDEGLVTVDVTVDHTENHMDYKLPERLFMNYNGALVELIPFNSGDPVEVTVRYDVVTSVFRFTPDYEFEPPESGFEVVQFDFEAVSIYDFHSDIYTEHIVIVDYPRETLYGDTDIEGRSYSGQDPDGWFAPEHNVHSEFNLWSPYPLTVDDIMANYDYLGDFVDPWFNPDPLMTTEEIHEIDIEPDGTIDITFYEYVFVWEVITDAQSIWSLILPAPDQYPGETGEPIWDGYHIPVDFETELFWSTWDFRKWIQCDKNDPAYSTVNGSEFYIYEGVAARAVPNGFDVELYVDDGGTAVPFSTYYPGSVVVNWEDDDLLMTVELPYDELPDFTDPFIVRLYATDYTDSPEHHSIGGAGVDEIYMPASVDFDVTEYAAEPVGENGFGVHYQQWVLTPVNPLNHEDTATLDLGEILDLCNHDEVLNPTITFNFIADYDEGDYDNVVIYDWQGRYEDPPGSGIMWPIEDAAPYVRPGDAYGVSLPIDNFELRDTSIYQVYFNAYMLENYCLDLAEAQAELPVWRSMSSYDGDYYHFNNTVGYTVDSTYEEGRQLYTQFKISYTNGSEFISDWLSPERMVNYAIVDAEAPEIIEYGIEGWSETLTYEEEGYVVPDDRDGHLKVTFEDNINEYELGATPQVLVRGLGQYAYGFDEDLTPYAGAYPYTFDVLLPNDNITWIDVTDYIVFENDGTYWTAKLSGIGIKEVVMPTQYEIAVQVLDAVGNNMYDVDPATKFIEVTDQGPIVPVITGAEVFIGAYGDPEIPFTQFVPGAPLNGWGDVTGTEFWIAEGNTLSEDVTVRIYVRAKYEVYIEEMWLKLGAFDGYTDHETVTDIYNLGGNVFYGEFVMDHTMLTTREDVIITGNTIRHPFGAIDVFTDEFEITLHVDREDSQVDDAVVTNAHPGFENIEWSIDPDYGMHVEATIGDLRGALGVVEDQDWPMPGDLTGWFFLKNDGVDVVFATDNNYYPSFVEYPVNYDRDDDYETAVVYWDIAYDNLDEYWWDVYTGEDETFNFDIHYRSVYSEWFVTNTDQFNGGAGVLVDNQAPIFNSAFTYGEYHLDNETIVPYYPEGEPYFGAAWDEYAYLSLDYDDINGLAYILSDWTWFDGIADIQKYPLSPRVTALFEFPYNTDIYDMEDDISRNGDVLVDLWDNVGNNTDYIHPVNTTFVFEENWTFDPQIYPTDAFIYDPIEDAWYTLDGPVQMFADHTVMGFDLIDNDDDISVDEHQEGLVFGPLTLEVNSHVNNNWYPFPHILTTLPDGTIIFELDAPYGDFTEGLYSIQVNTDNIFGHHLTDNVDFVVDKSAPYVTTVDLGDDSYTMNDYIVSNEDWEYIRVHFADMDIYWEDRDFFEGVGVDFESDQYNDEDSTYVVLKDSEGVPVPGLVMTEWQDGTDFVKIVPEEERGWASDHLTSGETYTLYIYTWDKLGNYAEYTKDFFYNAQPADILIHVFDNNFIEVPSGEELQVTDELAYLGATVDDEFGMVTDVSFQLYFDENGNNIFDDGVDPEYTHIPEPNDDTIPYESTWNIMYLDWLNPAEYEEHIDVYNYDGTLQLRDWFVKVTAWSNSNQVAEAVRRVPVRDNVGPAPWLEDVTGVNVTYDGILADYSLEYDFDDPNIDNTSYIRAWCKYDSDMDGVIESQDNNWPDAWYVTFFIDGPAYDVPLEIGNIYQEIGSDRYLAFWDWNQIALDYPGIYTITAMGIDRVSNEAMSINSLTVNVFTRGRAYSEVAMYNFDQPNWDDDQQIFDWTEYGPNNAIQNILNLRLDGAVYNINEVQHFGFFYDVWDMVTESYVSQANPCPNDTVINPDMPADASMIYPWEVEIDDGTGYCSIVVPDDVYAPAGYDENDYQYRWYIMVTDYSGNQYFEDVYNSVDQHFRVDYVAPVVYIEADDSVLQGFNNNVMAYFPEAENTPDEYAEGYDFEITVDEPALKYKWSYDGGRSWNYFIPEDAPIVEAYGIDNVYYEFQGWNTFMIDELDVYNYEGYVWVTIETQDRRGNYNEAEPMTRYIDNQAPSAPISQVSYRGTSDFDNYEPSPYLEWHELGTLLMETGNSIICAYNSEMTPEDAFLRMRVHQTEIQNLSSYPPFNEPEGDLDPDTPITLYHAVGDEFGGETLSQWNLYDHEPDADGYYHFDLLMEEDPLRDVYFEPDTYHYFAIVAKDVHGNLEGDLELDPELKRNGQLSLGEFNASWDLQVYLVADDPVFTEIEAPVLDYMSEWVNLGAYPSRDINMPETVTFQWSTTGHENEWYDLETVAAFDEGNTIPYFMHIYKHELFKFKEWPFVPGIHVFNRFGQEIGDFNNIPVTEPYGNFDENDGPEGAWYGYIDIPSAPMGDNYGIYFIADLNDNGVIDGDPNAETGDYSFGVNPRFYHPNDTKWNNPNFRMHYKVAPYMTVVNTEELDARADTGIYYFRAVPDGDPRGAIPRGFYIDNVPPTVAIDIEGNDEDLPVFGFMQNNVVNLVSDVDDTIIYEADVLQVLYQYSGTAPDTEMRQWTNIGWTTEQVGDYPWAWSTVDPGTDNTDNDGDGYVDEYDELNSMFYLRSLARDLFGNYGYTPVDEDIIIDNSQAWMHIAYIDGVAPAGPNVVVNIPEDGELELIASDITEDFFDGAVLADFYYVDFFDNRMNEHVIEMGVEVDELGYATTIWNLDDGEPTRGLLDEGYYVLYVVAHDRVNNTNDPEEVVMTPIFLNDVTGPNAWISSIGGRPLVDGDMFFANAGNYNGTVDVLLMDPPDVCTVTLEYSLDGVVWHNIVSYPYDGGEREEEEGEILNLGWILPYEEDMTYYVRAFIEDLQGNDTAHTVMFYYDNLVPDLAVLPVLETLLTLGPDDTQVLDVLNNDVITTLEYLADANHGLYDVSNVEVSLVPIADRQPTSYDLGTDTYTEPGITGGQFTVDLSETAHSDEYELQITLTDFAENSFTYTYFEDYDIVIDVTPPEFICMNLNHVLDNQYQMPWYDVSDGNPIEFTYSVEDYSDPDVQPENDYFLGVEFATLTLTAGELTDVVEGVFDVDGNISYSWTPDALADHIYEGINYEEINIAMTLTDYYGNATPHDCATFTLMDTEASQARIITVDGNMVDWQEEEVPDVTATGDEAEIKAYVPVSMDDAQYVRFEYFDGENWIVIGTVLRADADLNVDPPYEYPLSDGFYQMWDISEMENGVYPVRAIAIDAAGFEMADEAYVVNVYIENCTLEEVLPVPYVWYMGETALDLVRGQMYDLTAVSDCPPMIDELEWKYRYCDENGVWANDSWFSIGFDFDDETPYEYLDWLIDHEMIPGLFVRVVALPTFTTDYYDPMTEQELVDLGLYVELGVVDVTAPEVTGMQFMETAREYTPLEFGFYVNNSPNKTPVIDNIQSTIMTEYPAIWNELLEDYDYMNDMLRVRLTYDDGSERDLYVLDDYWVDTDTEDNENPYIYNWNNYGEGWDISMLAEGPHTLMLEAWDTAENLVTFMQEFHIDVTAPTSALTITDLDGNPVDYLEKGETYLLTANAEDYMIAGYAYTYTITNPGQPTGAAIDIEGDAEQVEFTVPDDETVQYGAELEFTVEVTDMVGLQHQSSVTKLVFDSTITEIIITQIGGVPYVPELHINGSSVGIMAELLANLVPDQITQIAFKYRYQNGQRGRDWTLINPDDPVVPVDLNNDTAYDEWDVSDLVEGMVEIGAVPVTDPENIFEEPLWWATTEIDHTPPVMPAPVVTIPQFISDELRVEYATLPADISHGKSRFEYKVYDEPDIPETWHRIEIMPDYGFNGNWFFALDLTEENGERIDIFDDGQVYDFRLAVYDVAVDEPNMGLEDNIDYEEGVLYDITEPYAFISQIDDTVYPFDEPVEVELATMVDIYSIAFEMPGEYPGVSNMDYVEYYAVDGDEDNYYLGDGELIQEQDDHYMYWLQWPTTGLEVGFYDLFVRAYDRAGNMVESEYETIKIVSNIDPIAYIAGFDFDAEIANLDYIYAVTEDCVDNITEDVLFEYKENEFSDWVPFALVESSQCMVINGVRLWVAEFNANGMDVEMLRARAIKTNGEPSERFAFLEVEYVEDEMYPDGYFTFPTNENVVIYYDDVVDISNAPSEPYALAMNEVLNTGQFHTVQLLDPIMTVDDPNRYTAPIDISGWGVDLVHGNMITVWTTYSDLYAENIEIVTLENAETRIYPITEANGSNGLIGPEFGMHVNVPLDGGTGHIYFEPLHEPNDYIPLPFDWVPLAPQVAIQGGIFPGTMPSDFNIAYEPDPQNDGNLFGARYVWNFWTSTWEWQTFPADEEGWFSAPLRTGIYTFVTIADVDLEVEYVTVSHEWYDPDGNLWTQCEESCCGGGERPETYYDGGIDFEFRTFILDDDERDYQVDPDVFVDVYLDEVKIVDAGEVDPEWVGAPIEIDPVSGIFHVVLINCDYLSDEAEHNLEVDVYKNGYEDEANQAFWVDIFSPTVDNDGGGYIRHEMSMSATIYDPETWIIEESIHARLYNPEDVDNPEEHLIINYGSMEVTEVEYGFELSYTLTLDDLATVLCDTEDINEIYVEWHGANNVDMLTHLGENVVVYVVDIAPPIVWAVSPVGDPIDNDGDGLFNEDPINGINDDLDFDDWNNNGIQDGMWVSDSTGTYWVGEPSLIDEDPIDFWPDTLVYGTDIVISVAYEDIPMPIVIGDEYCGDCTVYSGASGVDPEGIVVTLNGDVIEGFADNGVWQYDAGTELDPGHYVVIASVPDMIGNVGMVSYEFEITGPAPSITFHQFIHNNEEVGWWYNPEWNNDRAFTFTVHTLLPNTLAQDGVVASFYAMPSGELLQGPTTLTLPAGENDYDFEIYLGYNIPTGTEAVLLEVEMTNIWGDSSVGSQSYGIDYTGPTVTIENPEDEAEFEIGETTVVIATYFDYQEDELLRSVGKKSAEIREHEIEMDRTIGSGVSWALLTVVKPNGDEIEHSGGNNYLERSVMLDMPGIWTATVVAEDMVGNAGEDHITFHVIPVDPSIAFSPFGEAGFWFNPATNEEPFEFVVTDDYGIENDGVVVNFYAVPSNELLQGPQTLTPYEVNDLEYTYHVNLGANIPTGTSGVKLEVTAENMYGGVTVSSQTYGIDAEAPAVTFESPMPDAHYELGSGVYVLATFTDFIDGEPTRSDNTKKLVMNDSRDLGSGIADAELMIYDPSGDLLEVEVDETAQSISAIVVVNEIGMYTAVAEVTDNVGNVTVKNVNFFADPEDGPSISFMPFNGMGYWFNPETNDEPFEFVVTDQYGIENDGVVVNFFAAPSGDLLQGPQTLTPYEMNDNEYTYHVNLGASIPNGTTGVILEVNAENIYGLITADSQAYGIDAEAPVVTFESPTPDAHFELGSGVYVLAIFTDFIEDEPTRDSNTKKHVMSENRDLGSGIADAELMIYDPSGEMMQVEINETAQSISAMVVVNEGGMYTAVAEVTDNVGNVTVVTINFYGDSDPIEECTITFSEYGYNNWWGPEYDEAFEFTVEGEVAENGIVAYFYGMPDHVLLQGPQIVGSEADTYMIDFTANISEDEFTNLILEVEATNIDGFTTVNNQVYAIDMVVPVVTIESPEVDAVFNIDEAVEIRAYVTDGQSGINSISLMVDGHEVEYVMNNGAVYYPYPEEGYTIGIHTIEITAMDNVHNATAMLWRFEVTDVNAPFEINEAFAYPNPCDFEEGETMSFMVDTSKSSLISLTIYDFAGNEVIKLKSVRSEQITWDGRTAKGTKIARGIYFAKITANDGKKVVEKIVKIAIKG